MTWCCAQGCSGKKLRKWLMSAGRGGLNPSDRRQLYPPVRLNHRYGSNRSPDPPILDLPDLHNTGWFSCFFCWGAERPEKQQLNPPVLCKPGEPRIGESGDRFEPYRWFSPTGGCSCLRLPSLNDTFIIFNCGSGPENGHETALELVSGAKAVS